MALWPTDLAVCHANQNGHVKNASTFEFVSGAIAALSFTIIYILAPLSLIGVPILICVYPYWWLTWMLAAPLILSALLPPVPSRSFLQSLPFKHMPKYFNFTEIKELGDAEVQQLISNRATIFCVQPHGVFSFGGASAGVTWAKNWWHPATIPTAVASSVSATPLVKHLVGLFGTCDAATKPMTKRSAVSRAYFTSAASPSFPRVSSRHSTSRSEGSSSLCCARERRWCPSTSATRPSSPW